MKTKNVTEKNMKVCLVGSSGGHLTHLYMLKPFWKDKNRFWVTFDKEDARSLLEGEKVYPCYFPTNRSIKALIKNTKIAWDVLHKEKPDLIISCGAAVAVPFFYIGKMMGAKLVYIEVFDRIDKPTMTGKMVYGQHTIEARILRNGGRALPILCKVYNGMTMQQEALLFAEQNGHSAPLSAGIKLRAKVAGDDAPSKEFLAATNRVGLAFNYDSLQLSDYRISCVGTALKLYNEMGEKIYCESLRLIVVAWGGKPDSFRASVLRGMMHFVELYHGEFSEERLVRALGNVHPMEIYRVGRDNPAKLPGWKKYVFPIYMAYNGKGRKDALPMKF